MNNLNKQCVLHIGAPKTGSTALENFLLSNRDKLAECGWEYPEATVRGYGHHDLAYLVSGSYPDWALPQKKTFNELLEQLSEATADHANVILSSEIFFMYSNPADVANMCEELGYNTADVRVVLYIRRQDDAHLSWYNQRVKAQGYDKTIAASVDDSFGLWDYARKIQPWQDVFGTDNIVLRIFDKEELVGGDVRSDFLTILNVPVTDFQQPATEINTRLCRDILEFQRLINKLPMEPVQKRQFREQLMSLSRAAEKTGLFDDTPLLDIQARRRILASYAKSNETIAREYFHRTELFHGKMPGQVEQKTAVNGLDAEKLSYILGWILATRDAS